MNKKISVIIPTYNRIEHLKQCIESILVQTYKEFELIVVDDCSTENVQEVINLYKDSRIIYLRNSKNSGAGYSRKNGYLHATGEYIIFCDDDDYYTDNSLFENAIKIFENKEINLICCNSYKKYEKENIKELSKLNFESMIDTKEYLSKFHFDYAKPNSTFSAIFRKDILDKNDLKNMNMVNDASIYLRSLISNGKVYVYEEPVGIYRIHSKNISFNISADFLIANLEEKKYIYNKIIENKIIDKPDFWFEKQIQLTVNYFISGSNPSRLEKNKVIKWIKNNLKNNKKILLKLELKYIKKKLLGR